MQSQLRPASSGNVIYPRFTRECRNDFVDPARLSPARIIVEEGNPRGEYDTTYFAVGRRIDIEDHLPFLWPRERNAEDRFVREAPRVNALAFRVPSGQIVVGRPTAVLAFTNHPQERELATLDYPDVTIPVLITENSLDAGGNPLMFDLKGYSALTFSLSLSLTGLFQYGDLIVETSHVRSAWVSEHDLTRVSETPWRVHFELVGFELALSECVPAIYNPDKENDHV